MSKTKSAGLLLYRENSGGLEVLLVHPGGPFWQKRDDGAWTIPKGEFDDDEDPLKAAQREFEEETGTVPPGGEFIPLEPVKQPSGKVVYAWAINGDFDLAKLRSNMFPMEWPPNSGKLQQFPEVNRAAWLTLEIAKRKILKGQIPFIDQLLTVVSKSQTS